MFWPQVKSIFRNNKPIFIASFILVIALAIYFPSLGQESRLIEKQDHLNKESLGQAEKLDQAILLRDDLLIKTQGLDSQVESWVKRRESLENYLTEKPDDSNSNEDVDKANNTEKGLKNE